MKEIRGLYDFSWASFIYENIEKSIEELDKEINIRNKSESDRKKNDQNYGVGAHNNLEKRMILKVLKLYKES